MNEYKKFGYYYDEVMNKLNYDLWLEFIEPYLKPNDKILDLACGTGTLITMLKMKGYDAEGLDLSETILEIAKEKMKVNHLNFNLYHEDMTNFKIDKKYDMITCFFDSINFLNDKKKIKLLFSNVKSHLNDKGYFICDIFSKALLEEYANNDLDEDYVTFRLKWTTKKINPTTIKHTIKIIEDDEEIVETYNEYYYDVKDLMNNDFNLIKMAGDFNDDLEPEDERILLIFQKK